MYQLLRHLFVAAAAVGALLGHRATFAGGLPLQAHLVVEPQTGEAAAATRMLDDRLPGRAVQGHAANVAVAAAHTAILLLEICRNAPLPTKVARTPLGRA